MFTLRRRRYFFPFHLRVRFCDNALSYLFRIVSLFLSLEHIPCPWCIAFCQKKARHFKQKTLQEIGAKQHTCSLSVFLLVLWFFAVFLLFNDVPTCPSFGFSPLVLSATEFPFTKVFNCSGWHLGANRQRYQISRNLFQRSMLVNCFHQYYVLCLNLR